MDQLDAAGIAPRAHWRSGSRGAATARSCPAGNPGTRQNCGPRSRPPTLAWQMRTICDRITPPSPGARWSPPLNGHALRWRRRVAVGRRHRIAADDIRTGFNQPHVGDHAGRGGARRLAALVGKGRALDAGRQRTHPRRRRISRAPQPGRRPGLPRAAPFEGAGEASRGR